MDPRVLARFHGALGQGVPELLVLRTLRDFGLADDAMVLAYHFGQGVAHGRQKQRIGMQYITRQVKFNDGLDVVDRLFHGTLFQLCICC